MGGRPSTKKGTCDHVSTKDFSLGVLGMFLFLGKRNIPKKHAPSKVHAGTVKTPPFPYSFSKYTISAAMSAGLTPDTRLACPKFRGRIWASFCRASSRRPCMEA